jgi:hypothetical protein
MGLTGAKKGGTVVGGMPRAQALNFRGDCGESFAGSDNIFLIFPNSYSKATAICKNRLAPAMLAQILLERN